MAPKISTCYYLFPTFVLIQVMLVLMSVAIRIQHKQCVPLPWLVYKGWWPLIQMCAISLWSLAQFIY